MNAVRRIQFLVAAIALAIAASCSDSQGPSGPGIVTVSLVTPNADDGAIALTITGPGVSEVKPGTSASVAYWRVVSASEARVIVVGNLSSGVLATFEVPDLSKVGQYRVAVLEAASRSDVMRTAVGGYQVTVAASH